jgi:hypothetical protein
LSDQEQVEVRDKVRQIWDSQYLPRPSKARYGDPAIQWSNFDYDRNDDGFLFDIITEHDAEFGDTDAQARVLKAATAGDVVAQAFLRKVAAAGGSSVPAPVGSASALTNNSAALANAYAENARLRDENARLQAAVSTPPVNLPVPVVNEAPKSLGDMAKTLIDAVQGLDLSGALSSQDYATLDASIKILEMKNGGTAK